MLRTPHSVLRTLSFPSLPFITDKVHPRGPSRGHSPCVFALYPRVSEGIRGYPRVRKGDVAAGNVETCTRINTGEFTPTQALTRALVAVTVAL